jgi:carboxypeptidase family protein
MVFAAVGLYLASWMVSPEPFAVQLAAAPDAQVAGRVVDAISRTPIAGATVTLLSAEQECPPGAVSGLEAFTDANGEFILRVPLRRYRIQARKAGFAPLSDALTVSMIIFAAGQSVTDLELALQPGAAIAGRIVDANGGPLSEVIVTALRQLPGPGGSGTLATTVQTAQTKAQTNERGEYRIGGLHGGTYLLLAAPPPPPPGAPPPTPAMALAPTYYPGTPDKNAAEVIAVEPGQTVENLQLSLLLLDAREVSGVVVDESGSPLAGAIVALMADPKKGGGPTPAMAHTDQDGAFRIGGIVSGTYRVMAEIGGPPVAGGGPNRSPGVGATGGVFFGAVAPLEIIVGDTDVTGLRIVLPTSR